MSAAGGPGQDETLWTLEAWRGLAAWLVVYAHLHPLAGLDLPLLRFAFTGVDLFFVLSGFVFAPYLFGRPVQVRAFALRRFFRIYPAYVLALGIYLLMKWQSGGPLEYVWQHLVFAHLQSREMTFYYNPAFWSLPSEVEYYLLLPLLAAFTGGRPGRFAALVAGALMLRLALGQASDPEAANAAFVWLHHLPGMGLEFLLGACAWRLAPRLRSAAMRLGLLAAGLAGWLGLAALFAAQGDAGLNAGLLRGQVSWLAALCFAAMVAATALPRGGASQRTVWLANWAGRLSYGTYLLHIAALRVVEPHAARLGPALAMLAACALTLAGAWLLYQLWEDPWRRVGRRWAARFQKAPLAPAPARS